MHRSAGWPGARCAKRRISARYLAGGPGPRLSRHTTTMAATSMAVARRAFEFRPMLQQPRAAAAQHVGLLVLDAFTVVEPVEHPRVAAPGLSETEYLQEREVQSEVAQPGHDTAGEPEVHALAMPRSVRPPKAPSQQTVVLVVNSERKLRARRRVLGRGRRVARREGRGVDERSTGVFAVSSAPENECQGDSRTVDDLQPRVPRPQAPGSVVALDVHACAGHREHVGGHVGRVVVGGLEAGSGGRTTAVHRGCGAPGSLAVLQGPQEGTTDAPDRGCSGRGQPVRVADRTGRSPPGSGGDPHQHATLPGVLGGERDLARPEPESAVRCATYVR